MRFCLLLAVVFGCAKPPSAVAQAPGEMEHHVMEEAATATAPSSPIPEGMIRINLAFVPHEFDGQMATYFLPPGNQSKLWEMGTSDSEGQLPIGDEIVNGALEVKPGSATRFVLVMRNTTNAPMYFFAAPHHVNPVQLSLGFKFKCLCINHAFEVPPGHTWYRVVELRMDEGFKGNEITIEHALIGLDEERKKAFEMPH
jgi:hypothetical protein